MKNTENTENNEKKLTDTQLENISGGWCPCDRKPSLRGTKNEVTDDATSQRELTEEKRAWR